MEWKRLYHTLRLYMISSAMDRANYLKRKELFKHIGNNCSVMFRKIPLYPKLISLGDNVRIGSNVIFITHDGVNRMLNCMESRQIFNEKIGCIEIGDNVFVGANTLIMPNVKISSNTIIGAGTVVNKNLKGGVYAGVPVKYICSFEDYVEKMKKFNGLVVSKKGHDLTEETVNAAWEIMNQIKETKKYV